MEGRDRLRSECIRHVKKEFNSFYLISFVAGIGSFFQFKIKINRLFRNICKKLLFFVTEESFILFRFSTYILLDIISLTSFRKNDQMNPNKNETEINKSTLSKTESQINKNK